MPRDAGRSPFQLPSGRSILWREAAPGCSSASLASGTCGACGLPYQPASAPGASWCQGADHEPGASRGSASQEVPACLSPRLPSPEHPPAAAPHLSLHPFCRGGSGLARLQGSHPGTPLPALQLRLSFGAPPPGESHPWWLFGWQPGLPGPSRHKTSQLPACHPGAGPGGCRAAAALPAGLLHPPLMPTGSLRAGKALSCPGHHRALGGAGGCLVAGFGGVEAGSLPSAASWSHEPVPAALQEAAGPGDPLLLPVRHRDPLPR